MISFSSVAKQVAQTEPLTRYNCFNKNSPGSFESMELTSVAVAVPGPSIVILIMLVIADFLDPLST